MLSDNLLYETCLVRLLKAKAEERRDAIYYSCDGDAVSMGDLWARSGLLAAILRDQGLERGEVVMTMSHNSVDFLVLQYAILRIGAIFTPLNVSLRHDDLLATLERIPSRHLIISDELLGEHRATIDAVRSVTPSTIESHIAAASTVSLDTDLPEHHWRAEELCWILFSGATTGLPKAIRLPHAYGIASGLRLVRAIELTEDDCFFSVLQLCHGWLNFVVMIGCLLGDARCANTRWFSASRWLDQVRRERATVVDVFLPMAGALMAQPESAGDKDHEVRICIGAMGTVSEVDKLTAFEDRFGIKSVNIYGVTEGGGLATTENLGSFRRGSSGKASSHYEVMIADEHGRPTGPGEEGEILMRTRLPSIMSLGYLGDEARTLDTWRDLWIHSGDLGYIDADGFLFFTGRMPHWIRRKGENVSVSEIEDALKKVSGVRDVAVIGMPGELGDDDIRAFVILESHSSLTASQIHEVLTQRISFFKLPRYIRLVDDYPRTIKSEPERKQLRAIPIDEFDWDAEESRIRNSSTQGKIV